MLRGDANFLETKSSDCGPSKVSSKTSNSQSSMAMSPTGSQTNQDSEKYNKELKNRLVLYKEGVVTLSVTG